MIKLSIAIPTFNREAILAAQLAKVLDCRDKEGLAEVIEVIVVDNCSTDDTETTCGVLNERKNTRYKRHPNNIGMERNFYSCILEASGKYTWILSDDDMLVEGALTRIVAALDNGDKHSLLLNFDGYKGNTANIIFRKYIPIQQDVEAERLRDLLRIPCAGANLGFISGFIYRSDTAKAADWEHYLAFGSLFGMVGVILSNFIDKPSAILHESVVLERCEGWRDNLGNEEGFSLGYLDVVFANLRLNQSFLDDQLVTIEELNAWTYRNGDRADSLISGLIDRPLKLAIRRNNGLAPEDFNFAMKFSGLFGHPVHRDRYIAILKNGLSIRLLYDLLMRT